MPCGRSSTGKICLLGPGADQDVVVTDAQTTTRGLRQIILHTCGLEPNSTVFCAPRQHVQSLAVRGLPVSSIVGLVPAALRDTQGIFLDARQLACCVKFLLLPAHKVHLNQVLLLAGVARPAGLEISLTGAEDYDPACGIFTPRHGALLSIQVLSAGRASSSSGDASQLDDTTADFPRLGSDRSPSALRRDIDHLVSAALRVPMPLSLPGGEEEPLESPAEAFAFQRILCCILQFQHTPSFRSIWIATGEAVEQVAARAALILSSGQEDLDVLLPDPQPVDSVLCLLLVPSWWKQTSIIPFIISSAVEELPYFLQVAGEDTTLDDVLPDSVFQLIEEVSTFCSNARVGTSSDQPFRPQPGSTLFLQERGLPMPARLNAQFVLDSLEHLPVGSSLPVAVAAREDRLLILGPGFDLKMASLPVTASDADVAAVVGLDVAAAHIHHLRLPFTDLAFEGESVSRVVACRPLQFRSRSADRCGLFLDGRRLGRPVCYRSSPTSTLTVLDLLRLVDADVPSDLQVAVEGGAVSELGDAFHFEDGARVTLFVKPGAGCSESGLLVPSLDPHHGSDYSDSGTPGPSSHSDSASARSRSPRGHRNTNVNGQGGRNSALSGLEGPSSRGFLNVNIEEEAAPSGVAGQLNCHATILSVPPTRGRKVLVATTHFTNAYLPTPLPGYWN